MKTCITLLFLSIGVCLSGCYTVKLNYAPDDAIFVVPESPLIQFSVADKKMKYKLGFMKNKSQRFKHIRKIESLSKTALDRFRNKTLSLENYADICSISCISIQIVTWFAILEHSNGKQIQEAVKREQMQSLKSQKIANSELNKIIAQSDLETEDGIAEFLKLVAEVIEKILNESR
jgi:hypothetical protein